mmetsp:Transcript_46610/g.143758  ORF Transcript_46610/g.143758 Transcript_46610/m.143758 type:complete len:372 (-) Transcript_46610:52-1167(-)
MSFLQKRERVSVRVTAVGPGACTRFMKLTHGVPHTTFGLRLGEGIRYTRKQKQGKGGSHSRKETKTIASQRRTRHSGTKNCARERPPVRLCCAECLFGSHSVRLDRLLAALLLENVRIGKELRKEDEVRRVHDERGTENRVRVALAAGGVLAEDGRDHDEEQPAHHLHQLQRRDQQGERLDDLPRHAAGAHEEVVAVHDGVHHVVHAGEVNADGVVGRVREPAVEHHGGVVVPVQEDDRLLLEDEEDGVHQLGDLRQSEDGHPKPHGPVRPPLKRRVAHSEAETARREVIEQIRHTDGGPVDGEGGQDEIPHDEERLEVESCAILHPRLPAKNHTDVQERGIEREISVLKHPATQGRACERGFGFAQRDDS